MPKTTKQPRLETASATEDDTSLSPAQQRKVESLCDEANKIVRENGGRLETLASSLYAGLCNGHSDGLFGGLGASTPAFRFMATLCGTRLLMTRPLLSRCVRIGFLTGKFKTGGWTRLSWSMKLELLPLVKPDGDLTTLTEGIKEAQKSSASVRSIREWVAAKLGETTTGPDEKNTVSTATATRLFAAGRRLRTVATRRRLAERLGKLDNAAYSALMSDLDATLKHLQQLREELVERRPTSTSGREMRAAA